MKNKKAKIFLTIFFVGIFVTFVLVFSLTGLMTSKSNPYEFQGIDSGWIINKTDISIDVNKDRTATVVEKYEVNFFEPSYSMYRALPLSQNEKYYDVSGKVIGKSSDVSVETGFFSEAGNNMLLVYIDMPVKVTGVYNFELSYRVIPRTDLGNTNRFYMNVVGHGWTTQQSDVSVTVKFPSEINADESAIYAGKWADENKLSTDKFSINGDTLTVSGIKLDAFSGITVDLMFPKNTFDFYFDFYVLIALVVGLVMLFSMYFLKNLKAKNLPVTPIVGFYPPKDENGKEMTPLDVGYLIDNNTEPEDVTSMIYYFASKGYLRIIGEDGKKISFEKISELPAGAQSYEATIFNAMFARGPVATIAMLEKTFPAAVRSVATAVKGKYSGKLFEKKNTSLTVLGLVGVLAIAILYIAISNFRILSGSVNIPFPLIFAGALVSGFGTYICLRYHKFNEQKRFWLFIGYGIIALISCVITSIFIGGAAMGHTERAIFVSLAMAALMFVPFLGKRTEYYTNRLNDILGFRNFLQTTEKDKLEIMIESNPSYYYDILPYANVLGVSDVWQDKFKKLQVSAPAYYDSRSNVIFDIMLFNAIFRSSNSSLSNSIKAANRNNSFMGRGGFGGGGSRGGGGFGGGGGGRR